MAEIPENIPLDTHFRDTSIAHSDREILRRLAERVAKLAARDIEKEKARLWQKHNELEPVRPLVVCSPENAWNEIIRPEDLECSGDIARSWEWTLRQEIFWAESLRDDRVIQPHFNVGYVFSRTNWGLSEQYTKTEDRGAYAWDPPVKEIADIDDLRFVKIDIDYPATERLTELAEYTLGDILPIRRRMMWIFTAGLTWEMARLRGLENVMYDMIENPEMIHRLMAFLRDGTMDILEFLEDEGLLTLNNEDDYVGSGGYGWTKELPADGFDGHVRIKDLWGLAEAQEFTVVSPAMYEEFVFPYQLPLLERFGLACYGCCEPLHDRWHIVKRIPNLRRVSVSPWCDREKMVEFLGDKYIYSLKPNPSALAQNHFDGDAIRADIADTLDKAKGCHVEIFMKDTHTIGSDPSRVIDWVRIVREEIDKRY